jgi:hypothetical protein
MKIGHCIRSRSCEMRISRVSGTRGSRVCQARVDLTCEHPNHLGTPTIKASASERKAATVALFQKHYDTEVIDWIRTQGFKEVHELPHAMWMELSSGWGGRAAG